MKRQLISSGAPWEKSYGYSRAVVVGERIFVAGTAPVMPEGAEPPADAYGQAKRCLEIILAALAEAGAGAEAVVRTRVYMTDRAHYDEAYRAHGEVFGAIRPATAGIVVSGLLDPRWLVEVEADAIIER